MPISLDAKFHLLSILALVLGLVECFAHYGWADEAELRQQYVRVNGQKWTAEQFDRVVVFPEQPFWQSKKIAQKMREERFIAISVTQAKDSRRKFLRFGGAGLVKVPLDYSFTTAQKLEDLKTVSDHFEEVKWDRATNLIYLRTRAFGWVAEMLLQVDFESQKKIIRWRNVAGSLAGMVGGIHFRDDGRQMTEMSMTAEYTFEKLPLPTFFVEFGLEIVLQRVAGLMRAFIEEQFNKKKDISNGETKQ